MFYKDSFKEVCGDLGMFWILMFIGKKGKFFGGIAITIADTLFDPGDLAECIG